MYQGKTTTLAHLYFKEIVRPGDTLIDATLGNGHDTLFLAKLLKGKGKILAYDIQSQAFEASKKLFTEELTEEERSLIQLMESCHSKIDAAYPKLIVYNLGYLPHGDKGLTTKVETTLESLKKALSIISEEGLISITCYPGHDEGGKEEEALLSYLEALDSKKWSILLHRFVNRHKAPSLILIRRFKAI